MDVGVFACIKNERGEVLLVKDATRQELWTLPGGGPDLAELMPDALQREVHEETTLEIEVGTLLGIFSQKKSPGIVILFEAKHVNGTPQPDGKETQAVGFFSLEQLLAMRDEVKPAQLSMIAQVFKAKKDQFPLYNRFVSPVE